MKVIQILGLVAAILTTSAFIPQAYKVLKTKHTKDLSLCMYFLFFVGIILWLIYGIVIKNLPIIVANAVSFILSLYILIVKVLNVFKKIDK